jgi:hypothetical protein
MYYKEGFYASVLDHKTNFVLLHIIKLEMCDLARELIVTIDDELEKDMSRYPEVDWVDTIRKLLGDCIRRKGISEMYTDPVERAMLQEK